MTLRAYEIANTASQSLSSAATNFVAPTWSEPGRWINPVAQQIRQLKKLQPNWDSYGAKPISKAAIDLMIDLLAGVSSSNTPPPTLVPSAEGHLQAEWHMKGINLEVEAVDSTHIAVDYEGPDGHWNDTLSLDLRRLVRAIDRLSTP